MGKACNLDLRLVSSTDSDHHHHRRHQPMMEKPNYENPQQEQQQLQQQQQLTIFYNGSICVCDVTEFQARSILLLASRETEEKLRNQNGSEKASVSLSSSSPSSIMASQQLHSRPTGLYMKKSLQRFLQKRKHRAQAISPYNVNMPEMQSRRSLNSLICRGEERRHFIFDF